MRVRHRLPSAIVILLAWAIAAPAAAESGSGQAPCGVPYEPSTATATAHALVFPSSGRVVILYNPNFIGWAGRRGFGGPMFRYLMHHECGHHVLGHLSALVTGAPLVGGKSQGLELEADCYAARRLAAEGDIRALQAALMLWSTMGAAATGPAHPKGHDRADTLLRCYAGGDMASKF